MKYTQVHIFGRIHVRLNCSLIAAMYEKGRFMVSYRPIEGVFGFLHALALINTHHRSFLSVPTGSGSRPPCLCAPKSWRIRRGACRCVYGKPCTPGEERTGWGWKNWWDNSARRLQNKSNIRTRLYLQFTNVQFRYDPQLVETIILTLQFSFSFPQTHRPSKAENKNWNLKLFFFFLEFNIFSNMQCYLSLPPRSWHALQVC